MVCLNFEKETKINSVCPLKMWTYGWLVETETETVTLNTRNQKLSWDKDMSGDFHHWTQCFWTTVYVVLFSGRTFHSVRALCQRISIICRRRSGTRSTSTAGSTLTLSSLSSTTWRSVLLDYIKRRTWTKFGERCFSHAGPAAWSSLLDSIRLTTDTNRF